MYFHIVGSSFIFECLGYLGSSAQCSLFSGCPDVQFYRSLSNTTPFLMHYIRWNTYNDLYNISSSIQKPTIYKQRQKRSDCAWGDRKCGDEALGVKGSKVWVHTDCYLKVKNSKDTFLKVERPGNNKLTEHFLQTQHSKKLASFSRHDEELANRHLQIIPDG